ncbi:MAG: DUF418 domain-containing protein [Alphaproteobacteria bacterium]
MTFSAAGDAERHLSIDAVRGFAVLGILVMNIVGMGMPAYAYDDPTFYGGHAGADLWTWAIANLLVEGKMRSLFAMLFGASAALMAERASGRPGPATLHYRRMVWLFVFGLVHAYLLWWGDILTLYAVAGLFIFPLRKARPALLIGLGVVLLLGFVALNLSHPLGVQALVRAAAASGDRDLAAQAQWQVDALRASPAIAAEQIAGFGGGFMDALRARMDVAIWLQIGPDAMTWPLESLGLMILGMGLYRLGFFTLGWRTGSYLKLMAVGYLVALPVAAALIWRIWKSGFDPLTLTLLGAWQASTWAVIGLAHASALLLLIRSGAAQTLVRLLAAAGRMALSNYLVTSLITTLLFCGFGLGLYGKLSRFELMGVVAGIWAFILIWSAPWLSRFCYGPFEWLWRSLVRWKLQPFRRSSQATQ